MQCTNSPFSLKQKSNSIQPQFDYVRFLFLKRTSAWGQSTETEMSFLWNFHQWLYWKLSFWQLLMQTVMKILSKMTHISVSFRWPWVVVGKTLMPGWSGRLWDWGSVMTLNFNPWWPVRGRRALDPLPLHTPCWVVNHLPTSLTDK